MKKSAFATIAFITLGLAASAFAEKGDKGGRKPGDHPKGRPGEHMKKLDTDGDHKISFDEFKVNPRAKDKPEEAVRKMFDHLDSNDDGFITREDMAGRHGKRPDGAGKDKGKGKKKN